MVPGAHLALYRSPDGELVQELQSQTEFGSDRTFYVAERREGWLGVTSAAVPNGRLGWIRDDPSEVSLTTTDYSVHADLSDQTVEIRFGSRLVKRFPVTIGRSGSETPPGTFSVTDALAGKGVGPYYGCCVMALTGHQPNLPPGWIGGDRIAIHGTPGTVGGAGSSGCLRASDLDMVSLFALVPLGAPVFVKA